MLLEKDDYTSSSEERLPLKMNFYVNIIRLDIKVTSKMKEKNVP